MRGLIFCSGRRREVQLEAKRWQVDAAVLRLHSRRCTCLEFHPLKDNLVLSGESLLCPNSLHQHKGLMRQTAGWTNMACLNLFGLGIRKCTRRCISSFATSN